jgi:hypothetical protein
MAMATAEMWTYGGGIRTGVELNGYEVEARDGSIGTVDEASSDVSESYLIVDTGPWIFGKRVLLPAGVIERIDREDRRIFVDRTREEIKNAPEYDPYAGFSPAYRNQIGTYYGSVGRTGVQETPRRTQAQQRASRSGSSASRTRGSSTRARTSSRAKSSRAKSSRAKSSTSRGRSTRGRTSRQSDGPTKEELYAQAKRLDIEGRSKMNKTELARAVGRKRGGSARRSTSQRSQAGGRSRRQASSGSRRTKANPVEVQAFLDGVSYPTRKGDLVREAERSGARREVRSTLERLPEERFSSPTEVSEAIGKLR